MLSKSFECKTSLTPYECRTRIEEEYPQSWLVAYPRIRLDSITSDDDNSVSFSLMQSKIRGIYVKMDAKITYKDSGSQIEGEVNIPTHNLLLLIYFCVITLVLAFVFRPIPLLSLYLVFGFLMAISSLVITIHNRYMLINTLCDLLHTT